MKKWILALCVVGLTAVIVVLFRVVRPADEPAQPDGSAAAAAEDVPATPDPEIVRARALDALVDAMQVEEQAAQLFWVRCPESGGAALAETYSPAGYILFSRDFEGKTADAVRADIASYQKAASIPMLIGVDEEGGKVVRTSRFLRDTPFRSPQQVYAQGGLDAIAADAHEKDAFLHALGINVNLSPVADVSTDPDDFIYPRTLGRDAAQTADFVRTAVCAMKADNMGAVLKHFPGYGPNADTHTGSATDERPAETFRTSDFLPFSAGIEAGAGAVLVSHNVVTAFDAERPTSLSPAVHALLREELGFDGVIVTDDLVMDAIRTAFGTEHAAVLAVQAGNDLLISSEFETQYAAVCEAVQKGELSAQTVRDAARRVLAWKADLGLIELETEDEG